ncbi:MAG: Holliday junction branch migration protein RuvA [Candidatus Pacebacteria bacterium]|nr:Holliday junction branch migration protein RuvA [Candidatus Paceibacterota bacterium]MBP9851979.1 Holliday junction branch migration protein RuvA [Candidatus Paceibacterota bacterium]
MIAFVKGTIADISDRSVIIETQGVGYEVATTTDTLAGASMAGLGSELALFTHLVVREDSMELYGFKTRQELTFFQMLITVSGVGPRSAIAIVSLGSIDSIQRAIGSGDATYLTSVSGIGRKTAEKIIIDLRDKLAALGHTAASGEMSGDADAIEALMKLGYSREEARDAIKRVPTTAVSTNDKIREALKYIGK